VAASADREIKAFVFDMDGTILHTLPDLVVATNEALARMGFPERTYDEVLGFMGDGGARLIERAVPPGTSRELCEKTFELWRTIYIGSGYPLTEPFPGIVEALEELRRRGAKTAVLSNKFDEGARQLAERFFPGLFDAVRGDAPPAPRKPDPSTLLRMLDELGVQPSETAYVGDAAVDVQVARNAGVRAIGVSWGYDSANPLRAQELDAYLRKPADLLDLPCVGVGASPLRGGSAS